jgi:GSCFA family
MNFTLNLNIEPLPISIDHNDKIMLIGSCFTEHIADRLFKYKFHINSNPHGILFNPISVANSINSYVQNKLYTNSNLFQLNELWNSWDHHTRFSHIHKSEALQLINNSQTNAHHFIKHANWLIITLGSAFQYYLTDNAQAVANNHRAPAQWFKKRLLSSTQIVTALQDSIQNARELNPTLKIIFTISPVRHIRDGVIANNRSKAHLIEAVHTLCENTENAFYFPAYELVIDILRDYRFYDIDYVHPNYQATQYVWEQFLKSYLNQPTQLLIDKLHEIITAANHKPRFPETDAHQKFISEQINKINQLSSQNAHLDFTNELAKFL